MSLCIWYGLYATPKHHNHNLACGLNFGDQLIWTNRGEKDGPFVMVQPQMGTMVCFLAEHFWHEVLPAHKERMSITGWFRQRSVI
jgi:hypothetical protein